MPENPKSNTKDMVQGLAAFFQRDLISIPLINKHHLSHFNQRCRAKAAKLEFDTAAYPNIEYIAGTRLSIYPVNPKDHVNSIIKHLVDDLHPSQKIPASPSSSSSAHSSLKYSSSKHHHHSRSPSASRSASKSNQSPSRASIIAGGHKLSPPWSKFIDLHGKDSLRLALLYVYDIEMAPSRDLLRIMADSCSNRDHKTKLIALSKDDDAWESWICHGHRTLKSTLDEYNSCKLSAKALFSELALQQPRQYSIVSIKSNMRSRTEIIVIQHRFNCKHIAYSLQNAKEQERLLQEEVTAGTRPRSPNPLGPLQTRPHTVHVDHNETRKSSASVRSLRALPTFSPSPISTQQVSKVPTYSGPLMSMYAAASLMSTADDGPMHSRSHASIASIREPRSIISVAGVPGYDRSSSLSMDRTYEGLCSTYLLNLNVNDSIICEFVENPRFTLKGNRERPVMMIGQDIGVLAFRTFWQQRALEHDRAQIFYTLFKDLSPKKFGDMQLVYLTGNQCRVEDLFKSEMQSVLTNKVVSSVTTIDRKLLAALLEHAATQSSGALSMDIEKQHSKAIKATKKRGVARKAMKLQIESKELIELGDKIYRLLVENNGCLYTCCDAQMTQALEVLLVESILRHGKGLLSREMIMAGMMPKWKGRKVKAALIGQKQQQQLPPISSTNQFLYTLENPFERAQIVEEIYDSSI